MATYQIPQEGEIVTVRELIMALRKVGNHDAPVFVDCGGVRSIIDIEVTDMLPPLKSMVHIRGGAKKPVPAGSAGS